MKFRIPLEDKVLWFTSIGGFIAALFCKHHPFCQWKRVGGWKQASSIGIIGGSDGPTAVFVTNRTKDESDSNSYVLPLGISKSKLKEMLSNFFSFNTIAAVLRCLCMGGLLLSSISILTRLGKD
ncbi:MAG: hypothetical protein ACOX85_09140 [Candidatus Pararuminococcus gallinarum]